MEIKRLRKKLNLTQVEFGKIINKSHATIRKYESGEIEVPGNIKELLRLKYPQHFSTEKLQVTVLEPGENYTNFKKELHHKTLEVERLLERNAELMKINGLQARNIELLEEQIQLYKDRLKNYEGKTAS
ncbi:helix-turn-helix domain-containing protein [Mesonia algae]|nr:helix-turn-helix domain-containing protein [Mesonia algae]